MCGNDDGVFQARRVAPPCAGVSSGACRGGVSSAISMTAVEFTRTRSTSVRVISRENGNGQEKRHLSLYDGTAVDAARFYAATFPDSAVGSVLHAPGNYPDGKQGNVLTVEFTVAGIPCLGINGGPCAQTQRDILVPHPHRGSGRNRPPAERHHQQWRPGERVRLVQGQMGLVMADHATRADGGSFWPRSRGG